MPFVKLPEGKHSTAAKNHRLDGSDSTKMLSEIRKAIQDLDRLKSEVIMISWVKRYKVVPPR